MSFWTLADRQWSEGPLCQQRPVAIGSAKLITRPKIIRSRQSDAEGGMAEDPVCLYALSTDADDLGTRDC